MERGKNMKVEIVYLLEGKIKIDVTDPEGFRKMSSKDKQDWALAQLQVETDDALIEGTYHYSPKDVKYQGCKYDEVPEPVCIEEEYGDSRVGYIEHALTKTYDVIKNGGNNQFAEHKKINIEEIKKLNLSAVGTEELLEELKIRCYLSPEERKFLVKNK